MQTAALDYALPPELIAQHPPDERDAGRLLCLEGDALAHRAVAEWPLLLPQGALVVLNDTRVLRARLIGNRPSGGRVEVLLVRELSRQGAAATWAAMARPLKRLRAGDELQFGVLSATVLERLDAHHLALRLETSAPNLEAALEQVGHVPLPPYMTRADEPADRERYQTVFAKHSGSVAAPTAGLHLSQRLLARLPARGIATAQVTLHVGPGTFRPVDTDDLDSHPMHEERYHIGQDVADAIADARARGAPVIAVGTTVVRALESGAAPELPGGLRVGGGTTRLLIQPGYRFRVVDGLLTNFHMPRSTLLALVAAFAGLERVLAAYRAAVEARYRFLSYGDAMWIPERSS
ncbi:MAG: tRNA preQ1(34) S-adenosylmethionine ribosyltransferase-isomerase QueA [Polyangiaceae bacterium]